MFIAIRIDKISKDGNRLAATFFLRCLKRKEGWTTIIDLGDAVKATLN